MSNRGDLQQDALLVLSAAPDNYLILLPDVPRFTIVGVTDAYLAATLTKKEDILGRALFDVFPDNSQLEEVTGVKNLGESLRYVVEHKQEHHMTDQRYDVPNAEGDAFVYKVWRPLNKPVLDEKGEVKYIIHNVQDVTAQVMAAESEVKVKSIARAYKKLKKNEDELKEREERFRTMANSIPQLAWMTDDAGIPYWYNDRWYDYTGTAPDEMLGSGWRKVVHPVLVDDVVAKYNAAIKAGHTWEDVFLLRSKTGEYRWFLSRSVPVLQKDGSLVGWFGTNTDVTEQQETAGSLKKSEEQLLLAMEGGGLGFFDYNPQTDELVWSGRTRELFGVAPDALIDYKSFLKTLYPEDRDKANAAVQNALLGKGGAYENEYRVIRQNDGRLRWVHAKGKVFFDEDGKAYRLAGVIQDVTRQKGAEEALQQSERNLRNLVLQAPVAMCIGRGPSFIVEVANDRMLELWGKNFKEVKDHSIFDVLPEVSVRGVVEVIKKVYATGERYQSDEMPVVVFRNGREETVCLNIVYKPFRNVSGTITKVIIVAIDVTEQVAVRKRIEESQKEFQFAMDFLPQLFWLTQPDGYVNYCNKRFYDYTGLQYDEIKGEGWRQLLHPDDRERISQVWRHSLTTGTPYEIEYRLRRYDGQYRWFLARAFPLRDESGAITKWFGSCTDVHDQKTFSDRLEKKVAERTQELEESNEELQQFAHVSSHDLKEPLRQIRLFADRLHDESNECLNDKSRIYLSKVEAAAERMWGILEGVLAYSKVNFLEELYEQVDVNETVSSVVSDLELVIAEKKATVNYSDLPKIEAAPVMLYLVFYNLISNSLKFAKAGVPPVIYISSDTVNNNGRLFARIYLKDNGIGFEQQYAEKIFGTFNRLHPKDKYEGAGLGLAICKKIIERHGGTITARGEDGAGAVFEILLPVGTLA